MESLRTKHIHFTGRKRIVMIINICTCGDYCYTMIIFVFVETVSNTTTEIVSNNMTDVKQTPNMIKCSKCFLST